MTAVNISRSPASVHIATDGLALTAGGCSRLVDKTYIAAHIPLIVTCRGGEHAPAFLGSNLATFFPSFDEIVDTIEQALPVMHDEYLRAAGPPTYSITEVFLIGWSTRRDRAEAFRIRIGDEGFCEYPAGKLCEIHDVCYAPWPPQFRDAAPEGDDVDSRLLAVMERQRADFPAIVGGFCKIVTLTKEAITTRIVKRWDMPPAP